jgi:tetratricopeptide (TPR) repeat protein
LDRKIQEAVEKEATPGPEATGEVGESKDRAGEKVAPSTDGSANLEFEMVGGFVEGDRKKAKAAFEQLQARESEPAKRLVNEAMYLYWAYQTGDTSAQRKLQELEGSARKYPDAHAELVAWDAWCYKTARDYDRAEARFREAAAIAEAPMVRVQHLKTAAVVMRENGKRDAAEQLLIESLAATSENEGRAALLVALADLYEPESMEKRALMLEKALSYQFMDDNRQFAAGYAFSNADMNGLAVMHYEKSLEIKPKQDMAINNLGVAFRELKLPGMAVSEYKKSIELGGTLPASNLGIIFMDAGAFEEAKAVLGKAQREDNPHANVIATANRLRVAIQNEEERKQKIDAAVGKARPFLLMYADAIIDLSAWTVPLRGEWATVEGKPVSVKETGSTLEVIWPRVEGYFGGEQKYRFKGKLERRGASGEVEKFEADPFAPGDAKGRFQKYGRGHLYGEGERLTIGVTTTGADDFWSVEIIFKQTEKPPA